MAKHIDAVLLDRDDTATVRALNEADRLVAESHHRAAIEVGDVTVYLTAEQLAAVVDEAADLTYRRSVA